VQNGQVGQILLPAHERAPGGAGAEAEQQKVCACVQTSYSSAVTGGEERVLALLAAPERPN
jgi:hypothetical protein